MLRPLIRRETQNRHTETQPRLGHEEVGNHQENIE